MTKPLLIAHRGAQKLAPENTIPAFQLAIAHGFRAVECDVQLTRDGHLVVIHDAELDSITNGRGWIASHDSTSVRSLLVQNQAPIPTLTEVVNLVVRTHHKKLIVEVKAMNEHRAVLTALALAHYCHFLPAEAKRGLEVHSFWGAAIQAFKTHCPSIRTGLILNGDFTGSEIMARVDQYSADAVSLGYEYISPKLIRELHRRHITVDAWAVPDGTVLKRLLPYHLDGVVENYTDDTARV